MPEATNEPQTDQAQPDITDDDSESTAMQPQTPLSESQRSGIKAFQQAVHLITDFMPSMLPHNSTRGNANISRLRNSRPLLERIDVGDLEKFPLHKACAEDVVPDDDDLDNIKELIEHDPSRLHRALPGSGNTPLHVAVRFGAAQINQQIEEGLPIESNIAVIELLIETDIELERNKLEKIEEEEEEEDDFAAENGRDTVEQDDVVVAAMGESQKEASLSLSPPATKDGSLRMPVSDDTSQASQVQDGSPIIRRTAIYKDTNSGALPLHIAAREGYLLAAEALLTASNAPNSPMLLTKDNNGNTPLHLAVMQDKISMVQLLVEADMYQACVVERNAKGGDLPLHLALPSPLKLELWHPLLQGDSDKSSMHVANAEGVVPFDYFLKNPHLFKKDPQFVDDHLSEAVLDRFLAGKRLHYWDSHLERSIAKSPKLQQRMNERSANRLLVFTLLADLYAHMLAIFALFAACNDFLLEEHDLNLNASRILIYIGFYFAIREFIQLCISRGKYFTDFANYLGLVRIFLTIVSGFSLSTMVYYAEEADTGMANIVPNKRAARRWFVTTGAFMYLGLVAFLRTTYLPFALFVGGMTRVMVTLIPFLVCFGLILAVFAFGYWIGTVGTSAEQSLTTWVYIVFMEALSGPEGLSQLPETYMSVVVWTTLFGFVVNILLLNVLIAIITSEWEGVTKRSTEVFWRYRLEFAGGVLPVENAFDRHLSNTTLHRCISSISAFIDSMDEVEVFDRVEWDLLPYSKVIQDPSLYWKDRTELIRAFDEVDYSDKNVMRKWRRQRRHHSQYRRVAHEDPLDDDLYNIRSFEADYKFSINCMQRTSTIFRTAFFALKWLAAFILGFATLGLLWPRRIRMLFFGSRTSKRTFLTEELEKHNAVNQSQRFAALKQSRRPGLGSRRTSRNLRSGVPATNQQQEHDRQIRQLHHKLDAMTGSIRALQQTVETLVLRSSGLEPAESDPLTELPKRNSYKY